MYDPESTAEKMKTWGSSYVQKKLVIKGLDKKKLLRKFKEFGFRMRAEEHLDYSLHVHEGLFVFYLEGQKKMNSNCSPRDLGEL